MSLLSSVQPRRPAVGRVSGSGDPPTTWGFGVPLLNACVCSHGMHVCETLDGSPTRGTLLEQCDAALDACPVRRCVGTFLAGAISFDAACTGFPHSGTICTVQTVYLR